MDIIKKVVANVEKVIIGKRKEIYQIIKGILSGGHILIEDVPGVGKTMLVKSLARSLNLNYKRIQFTPDLLPSDITGISIFNQKTKEFEFKKGPIFANIILADEINRTSPKTQSALLEVMEELQISEGNQTFFFDKPFIVLATQNPVDFEGTFKLPEAQLDRFMISVKIGYTDKMSEADILLNYCNQDPFEHISQVAEAADILKAQHEIKQIHISKSIAKYIVEIVNQTRDNKYIALGASTRASLALLKIAQANAYLEKRDYVIPEDIKKNAVPVLSHRLILSAMARASHINEENVIKSILRTTHVPGLDFET